MFQIVNFTFTFIWNYMDLFVVMISQGIAYRFEQISDRIKNLLDKAEEKVCILFYEIENEVIYI